jgi:hypothetical protein
LSARQMHASLCSMSTAEKTSSIEEIPRLLFSRRSAAKALDVSVRLIDYAIASGLLEARRLNSRIRFVSSAMLRRTVRKLLSRPFILDSLVLTS